jgi:hypothetical protein
MPDLTRQPPRRIREIPAAIRMLDGIEVAAEYPRVGTHCIGRLQDRPRRRPHADDGRAAVPENAGLFAANALDVGTEPLHVVERDRYDDRNVGIDKVDGVQATTHADLEHDCVGRRGLEYQQRRKRVELEERQRVGPERVGDAFECDDQRGFRHQFVADPDPFAVIDQVRRREAANTIATGFEHRGRERDAGPLAVRAAHRDDRCGRTLPARPRKNAGRAIQS